MDIKSLALPPQTEEQKKKEREETAGLIQSFSKNAGFTELARNNLKELMFNPAKEAEKALIGAASYAHLLKYVPPTKEEHEQEERIRSFNESRQSLQETQERIASQQQNHKQMLIDVQVEAMRKFEAEKLERQGNQQVIVDAGKGSNAGIEPKPLNQNSNNSDFSGLLNIPGKIDDWFSVIDDMTGGFRTKWGKMPNETQAWGALWKSPPEGYEITTGKDRGDDCLIMPGAKPLSKNSFTKRWGNYTTNKP